MSGENAHHTNDEHGEAVVFEQVSSLQEVKLHAAKDETLEQLWTEASSKLNEPRRPEDHLQTDDGKDVMPYLNLTLQQLRHEHHIRTHKFKILGPTGGA